MTKLVYGKNKQVQFKNSAEKKEAFDYLLTSDNVSFHHENNQDHGAWGSEDRIHFRNEEGVPNCLKNIMTKGRGNLYGRINCKELVDEILSLKNSISNKSLL